MRYIHNCLVFCLTLLFINIVILHTDNKILLIQIITCIGSYSACYLSRDYLNS